MTILNTFPVGQVVELSALGREFYHFKHPKRPRDPKGVVIAHGVIKPGTIRVQIEGINNAETFPSRYWKPRIHEDAPTPSKRRRRAVR